MAMRLPCGTFQRALLVLLIPVPLWAQERAPLELPRLSAPVVIDGVPDDAAWTRIAPLPLTMYAPVFRGTPRQRTEIRVAYDDDFLYAAGWFYDSDSSGIRVNSLYRDRWIGDDFFAIGIDAFADKRNSKWFGTTPGGIRFDQLISDDGATTNGSWDTFWTAKTSVRGDGWFAEVRIPLSSIGFRVDGEGRAVMGLVATRLVSRTGERMVFPEVDPRVDFRRPSATREVALTNVRTHRPVYVTPYGRTGVARSSIATAALPTPGRARTSSATGVDVRYPVTSQLTVDLTANTDFAQVEADDEQVNLDRFPLYFPERRRFFQEGSGVFDFTLANNNRLFNSRRIGLTADAQPVPVLGGARIVGRSNGWDVGVLDMQTKNQGLAPRENFAVARLRHPVFNPSSTIGGMITRYDNASRANTAFGLDGVFRVLGDQYLSAKVASNLEDHDTTSASLADRSQFDLHLERRVERGLQGNVLFSYAGRSFDPAIGFTQRRNFTTANISGNYFFFTDNSSLFRRVYPGALAFNTFRNSDHALESAQYAVWVEWDTKAGGGGWIEPKMFHENVLNSFNISQKVSIPSGAYTFADLQVVLNMSSGTKLRAAVNSRAGTYFDGKRAQVVFTPTWNASPHLELGADYQLTHLTFASRHQRDDIQVGRLRIRSALDANLSANAFVQYNSVSHRVNVNMRVRYAFAEGTDLWLVYDEGLDTQHIDEPGEPRASFSLSRSFVVKYTRTFGF